jgi:hypothetical protein
VAFVTLSRRFERQWIPACAGMTPGAYLNAFQSNRIEFESIAFTVDSVSAPLTIVFVLLRAEIRHEALVARAVHLACRRVIHHRRAVVGEISSPGLMVKLLITCSVGCSGRNSVPSVIIGERDLDEAQVDVRRILLAAGLLVRIRSHWDPSR